MFLFIIVFLSVLQIGLLGDETPVENFVDHLQAITHSNKSCEVKFGYLLGQFPRLMKEINNASYTINGLIGVHNETAFNLSRTLLGVMEEFYGARKKRSANGVNKTHFFQTWRKWIKHTEGAFNRLNSKTIDFLKTNFSANASRILLDTCKEKSSSPIGIYKFIHEHFEGFMDAYFGYDFETAVHQVTGVFYITIAKLTMHQLICSSLTRSSIQRENGDFNVTMAEFFYKYPRVLQNITVCLEIP
ncbi:hypothetical protein DdX_04522 [Ditylenchus destructor]|uniref:Uncharacterized protein n=1 Tax=Ditylenchus destructor TaxID=166010 RepID=A0AAD4RAU5_9BILA|nr:hypothetical protein DdX_04522 [Ditylenchus destructor]